MTVMRRGVGPAEPDGDPVARLLAASAPAVEPLTEVSESRILSAALATAGSRTARDLRWLWLAPAAATAAAAVILILLVSGSSRVPVPAPTARVFAQTLPLLPTGPKRMVHGGNARILAHSNTPRAIIRTFAQSRLVSRVTRRTNATPWKAGKPAPPVELVAPTVEVAYVLPAGSDGAELDAAAGGVVGNAVHPRAAGAGAAGQSLLVAFSHRPSALVFETSEGTPDAGYARTVTLRNGPDGTLSRNTCIVTDASTQERIVSATAGGADGLLSLVIDRSDDPQTTKEKRP